jgi:outer membrane protein assembly factor BamB
MRFATALPVALLLTTGLFAADNWPTYRGPTGDGHSTAKGVPTIFGETENLRWKVPIHDKGWSSPVVWGDQVWVTTAKEDGTEMFAVCVDRTSGKVVHDLKLFTPSKDKLPDMRKYNSYASCTPYLEDGRGYFHFGTYGTVCLDTKTGKPIWERTDIHVDHYRAPASSPVVWNDLLFLTFDGFDRQYVTALNKTTGKTVWTKDRAIKYKSDNGDFKKAYSTPLVIEVGGKPQVISSAAEATIAYDPTNGDEIWKVYHGGMNEAVRPVYAHGLVYLTAGHVKSLLAVKPGRGEVSAEWTFKKDGPTRPSPIVVKDHIYFANDEGVAFCLNAKTGEQVWKERLGGPCTASPVLVEGNLFFLTENGKVEVIAADPTFSRMEANKLNDGGKASPAAVGDALIVRTFTHLYCFGKK